MFIKTEEFLQNDDYSEERRMMTIRDLHEKLHHDVRDIIYRCVIGVWGV